MPKFVAQVIKVLSEDIPVEAKDRETARRLVQELIDKGDTRFMFGTYPTDAWEIEIRSVCQPPEEEVDKLGEECEFVNPDGSHGWR